MYRRKPKRTIPRRGAQGNLQKVISRTRIREKKKELGEREFQERKSRDRGYPERNNHYKENPERINHQKENLEKRNPAKSIPREFEKNPKRIPKKIATRKILKKGIQEMEWGKGIQGGESENDNLREGILKQETWKEKSRERY